MLLLRCDDQNLLRAVPYRLRDGLTLLELTVVLAILAALSTVAVQSLDPLADQSRYEATQRVLKELRDVTVGERSTRQNGHSMVTGFLADTGSFPGVLADFMTTPSGLINHTVQSFDSDRDSVADVTLTSGWRGPYFHLGAGQTNILDGWGREPLIDPDAGDFDFTSLGSDGHSLLPQDGYDADLVVTIPASAFTSTATFRLFDIESGTGSRINPSPVGTEQLGVLLYCVNGNGGTSGAIEEVMLPIASSGTFETSRTNFIHGVAAARGVHWSDTDLDQQLDAGEPVLQSSYVHYFTVTGDADVRLEMELR